MQQAIDDSGLDNLGLGPAAVTQAIVEVVEDVPGNIDGMRGHGVAHIQCLLFGWWDSLTPTRQSENGAS